MQVDRWRTQATTRRRHDSRSGAQRAVRPASAAAPARRELPGRHTRQRTAACCATQVLAFVTEVVNYRTLRKPGTREDCEMRLSLILVHSLASTDFYWAGVPISAKGSCMPEGNGSVKRGQNCGKVAGTLPSVRRVHYGRSIFPVRRDDAKLACAMILQFRVPNGPKKDRAMDIEEP